MSTEAVATPPRARIAGVVYLLYFLTAISSEYLAERSGIFVSEALDLLAHAFYITLAVLLYYLFRPVSRNLSLLAALFGLVGCANDVLGILGLAPYNLSSLAFFGPYCVLLGYLILRSTFLPRTLGVLMALAGAGWLIVLSPFARQLTTGLMVLGFVAEAALMLWLIVRGVDIPRWQHQSSGGQQ
jgi:hypothetical protein